MKNTHHINEFLTFDEQQLIQRANLRNKSERAFLSLNIVRRAQAQLATFKTAALPDWKCRNKSLRAMRQEARELLLNGGYVVDKQMRGFVGYDYNEAWKRIVRTAF